MIIILLPTEQNLKISEQLKADGRFGAKICPFHQITFSGIQDDSLTLLDMRPEGTLQGLLEPEILADKLCAKDLP